MNETQKTGIFAAIAAIAVLLAFLTGPESITKDDEKGEFSAGDLLFKDEAADVTKAASLKITKFDENKLSMSAFEIVRDKETGLWKIPSEYSYPADAEDQLKNATSPLAGLKILGIQDDASRDDHALYGVIEPSEKLEAGVTGVGMMVNVADSSGKAMASLIIGKKVEDAQGDLHYVRIPNQDPIYTVEIDTTVFNTDFKKWIKPDLLTVRSLDIQGIGIRDYQTQQQATPQGVRVGMSRTMEADFTYDSGANKWALDRLVTFDGANPVPGQLAEGEEVKSDKLNSIRTAAQSLQIVGVRPKPKGLAADLKADKALLENQESMVSLLDQGFVPHEVNGTTEILATAGETLLTTGDGVRYTLRFGEENVVTALEAGAETKDNVEAPASKQQRFLLVTASLDESQFLPPELQPVPETIEDLKRMDAEKAAAEAAQKSATESENASAEPPAEASAQPETPETPEQQPAAADNPTEQPKSEEPGATQPGSTQPGSTEPSATEPAATENKPDSANRAAVGRGAQLVSTTLAVQDAAQESTQEPADQAAVPAPAVPAPEAPAPEVPQPPADTPATPSAQEQQAVAPAATAAEAKPMSDEELKDRLSVVQSEITKANQRLIDSRNERLEAARKRVQQLNARFADWYYLIDDASFKQLMLKRDQLIGPASAPSSPAAPAFPGLPTTPNFDLPQ